MLGVIMNIYACMIYESKGCVFQTWMTAINKISSKCYYFGFKATVACQAYMYNVGHDDLNVIE